MSLTAATTPTTAATDGNSLVWLVGAALLVAVLVTVGHLTVCWLRPFTRCRHRNPLRRRAVFCTRCDGTGYRVRFGRHVLNRLRSTRGRRRWFDDPH